MKLSRTFSLTFFVLSFVYLWCRNLTWMARVDEVAVVMAALPIFVWLGRPWNLKTDVHVNFGASILTAIVAMVILASDSSALLVILWTSVLAFWLKLNEPELKSDWRATILLPLFGVPWLAVDEWNIGWHFRLSAAQAVEAIFWCGGVSIQRYGTQLFVNNVGVDVEEACSGLGILQLLMIVGTTALTWCSTWRLSIIQRLILIVVVAWFSNTLRVFLIAAAAVFVSPGFAERTAHEAIGLSTAAFAFFVLLWLSGFRPGGLTGQTATSRQEAMQCSN